MEGRRLLKCEEGEGSERSEAGEGIPAGGTVGEKCAGTGGAMLGAEA